MELDTRVQEQEKPIRAIQCCCNRLLKYKRYLSRKKKEKESLFEKNKARKELLCPPLQKSLELKDNLLVDKVDKEVKMSFEESQQIEIVEHTHPFLFTGNENVPRLEEVDQELLDISAFVEKDTDLFGHLNRID